MSAVYGLIEAHSRRKKTFFCRCTVPINALLSVTTALADCAFKSRSIPLVNSEKVVCFPAIFKGKRHSTKRSLSKKDSSSYANAQNQPSFPYTKRFMEKLSTDRLEQTYRGVVNQ